MIVTESTTDSPEEVRRAIESLGLEAEVTVFSNEPESQETAAPAADQPLTERNTGDEAKPADESGTSEQVTQETAPKPEAKESKEKKSNLQNRIDEITRERKDAQRLADERATRIADLERQIEAAKPKPEAKPEPVPEAKPPVAALVEPKEEDFPDDYTAYLKALTRYEAASAKAELRAEYETRIQELRGQLDQKDAAKSIQNEREAKRLEAVAIGEEKYPDWNEIKARPETADVMFAPALNDALEGMEPENRADVTYYLVTHPDEAKALYEAVNHKLDAPPSVYFAANRKLGRELARIEAAIRANEAAAPQPDTAAPATPKPRARVSQAPPPIAPVRGGAAATAEKNPQTMNTQEFLAWRARTAKAVQ
jgi:hypothetical protein